MKKAHIKILQRKFAVKENRGIEQPPEVKSNWEFRVSLHFLRNLKQGDVTACVCAAWENRGGAGETLTGGEGSFQRPQGGAGCGRDVGLGRAPVGSRPGLTGGQRYSLPGAHIFSGKQGAGF